LLIQLGDRGKGPKVVLKAGTGLLPPLALVMLFSMWARPPLVAASLFLVAAAALPRALAQPSYLCQCHDLLWTPVQQADPNMTHWHDVLAAEVARNDRMDSSQVRRMPRCSLV